MKRILILDDEIAVRESFADFFEDQLWEVLQAGSAEEAIEIMKNEKVQAAIVDVRLPGMDGNSFIRKICETVQDTAFVICTGSPEYLVPADLLDIPCVCKKLMQKPVSSFLELEELVLETMAGIDSIAAMDQPNGAG